MEKINGKNYRTFDDLFYDDNLISKADREQIEFEVQLIGAFIEARESQGISQRQLAEISGVKQSAIARMESLKTTPQIDTLIKLLTPLGYTLSIQKK